MSEPKPLPAAYIIPTELVLGLKAYLEQRPYHEVANGIAALAALTPYTPDAPADA